MILDLRRSNDERNGLTLSKPNELNGKQQSTLDFKLHNYIFQYTLVSELGKPFLPRLKRDKNGVVVFPTIHMINADTSLPHSGRAKKKFEYLSFSLQPKSDLIATYEESTHVVPLSLF